MADEIPLAYDKTTGGSPVGLKEIAPGNQLANQWLAMPAGYIEGLSLEWVSGSSIRITPGACAIPGVATLTFPAPITKAGLALGNSVWGHVYAYLNSGAPDFEINTTAPSSPYSGTARNKTSDTTRRYIGSLRTDSSGAILAFVNSDNGIKYTNNVISNIVLNAGTATTSTTVDVSAYCPVTSRIADALCYNSSSAGGAFLFMSNPEAVAVSTSAYLAACGPASYLALPMLMDSTQRFTYMFNQTTGVGAAFIRIMGYKFAR